MMMTKANRRVAAERPLLPSGPSSISRWPQFWQSPTAAME